jgi:cell division protein FtsB
MKKFFLIILGLIIAVSIINNIKTQYSTLKEAKKQNLKIEEEIESLKQGNQILAKKIGYATSSAFIDQEAHDKLGMGKENDVWLILKEEEKIDLFPKTNETEEKPKIKQWIKLFTQ